MFARALRAFRPSFDNLLDRAAAAYLAGDTAGANSLVEKAKRVDPHAVAELTSATQPLAADLASAVSNGTLERTEESDKYTDSHVEAYWNSSHRECGGSPRASANAMILALIRDKVGDLIAQHRPDGFLEFGCAYGLPIYTLAQRFPDVSFVGVDRQVLLKERNEGAFVSPNLEFRASNVFDAIPVVPGTSKMLIHVRTGIMVYPTFLEKLYADARRSGFRYVVAYEIAALGRISWTFRDQGSDFATEAHRSTMFIHDYASAMRRAGFEPIVIERMPHGYRLERNPMLPGDLYTFVVGIAA